MIAEGGEVLEDAAVVTRDGLIVEVGPWAVVREQHPDATVLGGEESAVMPGLVNAHHHSSAVSDTQQGRLDNVLEPWLLAHAANRSAGSRRDSTMFAAGRLLRTGVTSVVDMAGCGSADASAKAAMEEQLLAYETAGLRGCVCPGYYFRSRLVHNGDAEFLDTLPARLRARVEAELLPPGWPPAGPDDEAAHEETECTAYLAMMEALLAGAQRQKLRFARLGYGPPGLQWVGEKAFQRIAAAAEKHDTIVQTHVQESLYERLDGPRHRGASHIAQLHSLGCLSPRISLAHCCWASEADLKLCALPHIPSRPNAQRASQNCTLTAPCMQSGGDRCKRQP